MLLVFGKASEFYISRRIQNGRSSFVRCMRATRVSLQIWQKRSLL